MKESRWRSSTCARFFPTTGRPSARASGKTSRVLVAYEDTRSFGYGAEIAARIADELFEELDAPVRRVAAKDTWIAYNPALERGDPPPGG